MADVLIIQLARFGDLVQTRRLAASLAARGHVVHLCIDASLSDLARIVHPEAELHPIAAHGTALAGRPWAEQAAAMLVDNRRAFARLVEIPFKRVFNLNFSPLNFALASLFDPEAVRGFVRRNGQEVRGQWPDFAMRWTARRRQGINLADFWAHYVDGPLEPGQVNPQAAPKGGGIGVVTAGRESRRSLPAPLLAAIASSYAERLSRPLVILGSASERAAAKALLRELPERHGRSCRNLAGGTDWQGLADTVAGLDLLITPDTGTMHLACRLGTPVAAFFLSSAWCFETGPYGLGHTVFQSVLECSPCLESRPCPNESGGCPACLGPFGSPAFLRYLATGKSGHAPECLLVLQSRFDSLGVTYEAVAGADPSREGRDAFRDFLKRHLDLPGQGSPLPRQALAEAFYEPRDWLSEFSWKDRLI